MEKGQKMKVVVGQKMKVIKGSSLIESGAVVTVDTAPETGWIVRGKTGMIRCSTGSGGLFFEESNLTPA
jgi:hypothetical protein